MNLRISLLAALTLSSSVVFAQTTPSSSTAVKIINQNSPEVVTEQNFNIPAKTPRFINSIAVPTIGYSESVANKMLPADLKVLTSSIRKALSDNGYSVIEVAATNAAPMMTTVDQAASSMSSKIGADGFANAAYVLVGVVSRAGMKENTYNVYGDASPTSTGRASAAVDFRLIDHDTKKSVYSFVARGTDNYTPEGKTASHKNAVKVVNDTIAADVIRNMQVANIMPNNESVKVFGADAPAPKRYSVPVHSPKPAVAPLK